MPNWDALLQLLQFHFHSQQCLTSKKLSSKAKSQWQAGQSSFGPVKFDTKDGSESEYNDSDDEASSDEENTLQSISAMQSLYSVFLPAHLCMTAMKQYKSHWCVGSPVT